MNTEQLNSMTVKKLVAYCKDNKITGYSRKKKSDIVGLILASRNNVIGKIDAIGGIDSDQNGKTKETRSDADEDKIDVYTKKDLLQQFDLHIHYVNERINFSKKTGIKIRLPALPEDISENMIKFIIRDYANKSSYWAREMIGGKSGDLYSEEEHTQECKCFTSPGPISFTPSSHWDIIYFLDARKWLVRKCILYRTEMSKEDFGKIKINGRQTFDDQCKQKRRPRIGWVALLPQIKHKTKVIFTGKIDKI